MKPIWDNQTWIYTVSFDVQWTLTAYADVALVFDGVKMAATVSLNGNTLGTVADMFLRYRFPVASYLLPTNNTLQLAFFTSNDTANNEGRWTSCSGGWLGCLSYVVECMPSFHRSFRGLQGLGLLLDDVQPLRPQSEDVF